MLSKIPTYIFVSGGVISGLGKGITTASIALLLKSSGYRVSVVKCENYLNFDAGLINPIEHGDPFLCEDGTEADMDLGSYEKFLDQDVGRKNFVTMGQIYQTVIQRERNFGYKGEDVEAIPHVTDEIIGRIEMAGQEDRAHFVIIELGGTAGEYQNALYYEAARIMRIARKLKTVHVHVSYLPTPPHIGEPKTKPTQLSVKQLNSMGIQPDFIVARSERGMDLRRRERFALFCNVEEDHIINAPDVTSVYEVPLLFRKQRFDIMLLQKVGKKPRKARLTDWERYVSDYQTPKSEKVKVGIVGKYFATGEYNLRDSYAALFDALEHASVRLKIGLEIDWINSEKFENEQTERLASLNGIIVPIGWGPRGVEGKIKAIKFARENKVPYLGLCYGMQLAVVEFARNVLKLTGAHTTEVDPQTSHPVIHMIPEQKRIIANRAYGGTMRLGAWECSLKKGTLFWEIYDKNKQFVNKGKGLTSERHRHRFEFNEKYVSMFEKAGMIIAGLSVEENLVELIELPRSVHPFFAGTQGHPEYKSRPLRPHGVFISFLENALAFSHS
ncbi:CTP synthase [Microgenomates group bacterium RIFCSPLOWO2_01_FULL_46_13]|nr:MAG: CTP synthase [Microgenomates group bacterium RIFCSPHIGHO2_01_FULL_45_11]OGV94663.1 MAG: CTP synthase [Microgenomates group bacterium RIFCSPLOWO2_01_FULL_46_13]